MTTEILSPNAIVTQTGLTGALSTIQDSPTSPDGNWMTATTLAQVFLLIGMPTPTQDLNVGAGLQKFSVYWRKNASAGSTLSAKISLYEGGVLRAESSAITISSTTGVLQEFTWDASLLTDPTGAGVEVEIEQTAGHTGGTSNRRFPEIGAVSWTADFTVPDPDAINITSLEVSGSSTNGTSFTTGSITPTANSIVFLAVTGDEPVTQNANPPTASATGCGLTWELVDTQNIWEDGLGTYWNRLTLLRAQGASPTTGQLSITMSREADGIVWSVFEASNVVVGNNGTDAIVQVLKAGTTGTQTSIGVTLAALADDTNNVTIGVTGRGNNTSVDLLPGTGYTELHDHRVDFNTVQVQYKRPGSTSVSSSCATAVEFGIIGLELQRASSGSDNLANLSVTSDNSTISSSASVSTQTNANVTNDNSTLSSDSSVSTQANVNITGGDSTLSSGSSVSTQANASLTSGDSTLSSTSLATVGADSSTTSDNSVVSSSTSSVVDGSSSTTSDDSSVTSSSVVETLANSSTTSDNSTVSSDASLAISAIVSAQSDDSTLESTAGTSSSEIFANLNVVSDDSSVTSSSLVGVQADSTTASDDSSVTSSSLVGVQADSSTTSDDSSVTSSSLVGVQADSSTTSDDSSVTSSSLVSVQANSITTSDDSTLSSTAGEAENQNLANLSIQSDSSTLSSSASSAISSSSQIVSDDSLMSSDASVATSSNVDLTSESSTVSSSGTSSIQASSSTQSNDDTISSVSSLAISSNLSVVSDDSTINAASTVSDPILNQSGLYRYTVKFDDTSYQIPASNVVYTIDTENVRYDVGDRDSKYAIPPIDSRYSLPGQSLRYTI